MDIVIGRDARLGAGQDREVRVVANYGEVSIQGPSQDWPGRRTLAIFGPQGGELDPQAQAESLARRIADDPAGELARLGYDASWLEPT